MTTLSATNNDVVYRKNTKTYTVNVRVFTITRKPRPQTGNYKEKTGRTLRGEGHFYSYYAPRIDLPGADTWCSSAAAARSRRNVHTNIVFKYKLLA